MIRGEEPIERIRKAHSLIAKAANCWNAGSTAAVEECVAVLEESAAELRAAQTAAAGSAESLRGCRNEILQMKERAARIERLPNLAARLLSAGQGSGGESPLYCAGGLAKADSSPTATMIIQA
jgi:hypothetical protein